MDAALAEEAAALFSAYAEVFLFRRVTSALRRPFLCLRRGVSKAQKRESVLFLFSLPTQRCFRARSFEMRFSVLFSAYAEVFPALGSLKTSTIPFLCLRRGVSSGELLVDHGEGLFSAYAEVFLLQIIVANRDWTFLCLRRGVSWRVRSKLYRRFFSLPTRRCFSASDVCIRFNILFSAYAEVFLSR